jgi:hypothetical protein
MHYGGPGQGPSLAENLSHVRPRAPALYFEEKAGRVFLVRSPGGPQEGRMAFSPAAFLALVSDISSENEVPAG